MRYTDENNISYELDETKFTAEIVWSLEASGTITIPRSVTYESKIYLVKSIHTGSFQRNHNIRSIIFANDSELSIIHSGAFSSSSLENLTLPGSLQNLENGWNSYLSLNFNISISPQNPYFSYFDNQIIIGPLNDETRTAKQQNAIYFAPRTIDHFKIPAFIEHINSFAFSRCKKIKTVDFSEDSRLNSIDDFAFYQSSLEYAIIPRNTKLIGQSTFYECTKLASIEFLCDDILSFGFECFCYSHKLDLLSCPNAHIVFISGKYLRGCMKSFSLFVSAGVEIKKDF